MGGRIVSELTMNSPWARQVNTPLPPVISGSGYHSRRADSNAEHPGISTSERTLSHITISSDDNALDPDEIQLLHAENATLRNNLAQAKGRLEALECVSLFFIPCICYLRYHKGRTQVPPQHSG